MKVVVTWARYPNSANDKNDILSKYDHHRREHSAASRELPVAPICLKLCMHPPPSYTALDLSVFGLSGRAKDSQSEPGFDVRSSCTPNGIGYRMVRIDFGASEGLRCLHIKPIPVHSWTLETVCSGPPSRIRGRPESSRR